jgi:hypothetical protein
MIRPFDMMVRVPIYFFYWSRYFCSLSALKAGCGWWNSEFRALVGMGCISSKHLRRTPGYEDPNILAKETTCKDTAEYYDLKKRFGVVPVCS